MPRHEVLHAHKPGMHLQVPADRQVESPPHEKEAEAAPQEEAEAAPQEQGAGDDVSQEEIQEFINSLPPDALTSKSTEEDEESE